MRRRLAFALVLAACLLTWLTLRDARPTTRRSTSVAVALDRVADASIETPTTSVVEPIEPSPRSAVTPLAGPDPVPTAGGVSTRENRGTIVGRALLNGNPTIARASWRGPTRSGSTKANGEGRFSFDDVELARVIVVVNRSRGYAASALTSEYDLDLGVSARVERDFDLVQAMVPIRGRVIRLDGGDAAGLDVTLNGEHHTNRADRYSTKSGANGAFAFEVPPTDATYGAGVRVENRSFGCRGIRPGDQAVEIVVREMPTVLCRAIDIETREPIAGIDVRARAIGAEWYQPVLEARSPTGDWSPLILDAGTFDFVVLSGTAEYVPCDREGIVIPSSGETRIEFEMVHGVSVELRLVGGVEPWAKNYGVALLEESIADAIENNTGKSRAWADLNPRYPGIPPDVNREVNPTSDGVAVVRGLAPGRYRLCAGNFALEFTPAIIDVRATGSAPVDVSWREK